MSKQQILGWLHDQGRAPLRSASEIRSFMDALRSLLPYGLPAHSTALTLFFVFLVFVLVKFATLLVPGPDWHTFYEASHYLVRGQSPYLQPAFANPPWALLPAIPIAILFPEQWGRAIWFVLSFLAFAVVAYRLGGAKRYAIVLFLIAPTTVHCLLNGNIDWLPLLGFSLPPRIGLVLTLIKPQIGLAVSVFWIVEASRKGRIRELFKLVYPTIILYALSFGLYGFWLTNVMTVYRNSLAWNASFWPYSVPVGILLLAIAIYKRRAEWAFGASPCLSPYALFHVWNALLVAILKQPWVLASIVALLWILVIMRL